MTTTLRKELEKIREPEAAFSRDNTIHWRRAQMIRWEALANVLNQTYLSSGLDLDMEFTPLGEKDQDPS